jgi:hypothetical protein
MLPLTLVSSAIAQETEVSWGCFGTGDAVGYMLIALMLLMLLFMRVHRRERSLTPPRIPRSKPGSVEELARLLFDIVQRDDVQAYRGLFLMGLEVQKALGDEADAYIASRRPGMFEASLARIASRIPSGSTFDGARIVGSDALALRLQSVSGSRNTVIVGTVTEVDGVYRMVHPGFID